MINHMCNLYYNSGKVSLVVQELNWTNAKENGVERDWVFYSHSLRKLIRDDIALKCSVYLNKIWVVERVNCPIVNARKFNKSGTEAWGLVDLYVAAVK